MDIAYLIAYVAIVVMSYVRVRSMAWMAIALAFSISAFGVLVSLGDDLGHGWTRPQLQVVLLIALLAVLGFALKRGQAGLASFRRQLLTTVLPILILLIALYLITVVWVPQPAYLHPVAYLVGHESAEDNAKWLDFTSQYASGVPIHQAVTMGGPLELYLTFIGTAMGAVSQFFWHGYNQVAVAANSVVFGEYFFVVISPLFLAPLAEARVRAQSGRFKARIPAPFIWLSTVILAATVLLVTEYGHMTLQFTLLVCSLWAVTFLTQIPIRRARLMTSLIVAGAMTVWLPLNVLAVVILAISLVVLVSRPVRFGRSHMDIPGMLAWLLFAICVWEPVRSSLAYLMSPAPTAAGRSGVGGAIAASTPIRQLISMGLDNSGLFSSNGGTEQTEPLLAMLAAVAVIAAAVYLSRQSIATRWSMYKRFAPIALLACFALLIYFLDFWSTGGGPHYGSMKFTFMVSIVAFASCTPFALMNLSVAADGRMSAVRWIAIVAVIYLMTIDSFLPRAVSAARPQQWSPSIPFNNPQSYWWPAEVNGTGSQSIAGNPIGCVYLPQEAKVPSALLVSQLSDAQRVYACTRILSGLSGQDAQAQPVVDWLRREWLGNKGAWSDVYGYLQGLPDSVKDKQMILLDDGSNVIGLDTIRYLLERYPADSATAANDPTAVTSTTSGTSPATS